MTGTSALLLALVLLLGNALFVGAEFALVSARRTQIEPLANAGSRLAKITLTAMENISLVIGVNQLGITVCSLVLGAVGEPAVAHVVEPVFHAIGVPEGLLHPLAFTLALGVVVYLHVVMGEMIPKNLALAGPDRVALLLGPVVWGFVTVLRPFIVVINLIAAGVLRLVGVRLQDEVSSTYTREQVAALVEESRGEGLLADGEYTRLAGALGFTITTVAGVILPLSTLSVVRRDATPADLEALCADTGFSRFPVTDDDDALIGYLHIKDVLSSDPASRDQPIRERWIRSFAKVRDTDLLHDVLATLQRTGAHLARVEDAERTLLGLVTMEDVLEELVGEIRDGAHQDD